MRSFLFGAAVMLILGGASARLYNRWREEAADHRIAILTDWAELRDAATRQGMTDEELLERLKLSGANTLLVGAYTVQDYLWQNMSFSSRAPADTVKRQLEERGVVGVNLLREGGQFRLTSAVKDWERLKDMEVGFNPELLQKASQAGFHIVLRVNNDPWLSQDKLFADLAEIGSAHEELGFLFNTDEIPGGAEALPQWGSFLTNQNYDQLIFEFHPSKSALKAAYRFPQLTYRAHTIPTAELKDLTDEQERSRWRRAVEERSCRFLLFHMAGSDTLTSYFENIYSMAQDFTRRGWVIGWPRPRVGWSFPSFVERQLDPWLALLLAILVPVGALRLGQGENLWASYAKITFLTLVGACVMAALADNPLARIEIVPFRGVKLAFALAWAGSFLVLYSWKEIKTMLDGNVRRIEILAGFLMVALIAYFLIRTGNAGTAWKAGWEQGLRDRLEDLLIARPRFKEFAIGYPLLILGLQSQKERIGRLLVGLGMIGPISMVNTFCHLHSPLYLALWRSANGILLGAVFGASLIALRKCLS
jgi:hypothetical protein